MSRPRLLNDHELELLASSLEYSAANLRTRVLQIDSEQVEFRLRMQSILHALRSFAAHSA